MSPRALPPGVSSFRDRHNKLRWRYRRAGKTVQLGTEFGTAAFRARLQAAIQGAEPERQPPSIRRGSVCHLIQEYRQSARFARVKGKWRAVLDRHMQAIEAEDGHRIVADVQAKHMEQRLQRLSDTPSAANRRMKLWRRLLDYAQVLGWITGNPAKLVDLYPAKTDGYHTWTDAEIARFMAAHPPGSTARLAMGLMLFTGAAKVDVVTFGPRNIEAGRFRYRRSKTGAEVDLPLHPALSAIISDLPPGRFTYLETGQRRRRSENGLGNLMRKACDGAGLPGCSSHGLRKACARRLAEAGATASEIASVTGHSGLAEVERYTRAASRATMADSAWLKVLPLANPPKG